MTAKQYLSQLERLEKKIYYKKQELIDAKRNRGLCSLVDCAESRVQTSFNGPANSKTERQALLLVSLEEELSSQIIEYMDIKQKLIDEIHDLNDSLSIDILYHRYVRFEKSFTKIAAMLGYSYKYIINKHGEALEAFIQLHPEISTIKYI